MNATYPSSMRLSVRLMMSLIGLAVAVTGAAPAAQAHAGGGLAIDQYFALDARGDGPSTLHYRLHMGEIASFRDFSALDPDNDGIISEAEEAEYLSLRVPLLVNGLAVEVDGEPAPLEVVDQRVAISEGETGLDEISIILALRVGDAPIPTGVEVVVRSGNMRAFNGDYELKLLLGDYGYALAEAESFGYRYQREIWVDADGAPTLANLQPQWVFRIAPEAPPASPSSLEGAVLVSGNDDFGLLQPAPRPDMPVPAPMMAASAAPLTTDRDFEGITGAPVPPPPTASLGSETRAVREGAPMPSPVETMGQGRDRQPEWFAGRLTEGLRSEELTFSVFLLGLALAIGMGMGHAFSPGHGKTVMAAYLIGERGTYWHAFMLGVIVTVTHTWSVLLLGIVVLFFSEFVSTEVIQFWTGIASGVIILVIGVLLFRHRYTEFVAARLALAGHGHPHPHAHDHDHGHHHHHEHDHDHDHGHSHDHDHDHDHGHGHHHHHGWLGHHHHDGPGGHSHVVAGKDGQPPSFWSILWLGISGGIVPCPAALIVLLLAIRLGRLTYGLALIVAFSVGLAAVLIAIGFVVVKTAGAVRERTGGTWLKALPVASSVLITLLGGWVVVWTLIEYNIIVINTGG